MLKSVVSRSFLNLVQFCCLNRVRAVGGSYLAGSIFFCLGFHLGGDGGGGSTGLGKIIMDEKSIRVGKMRIYTYLRWNSKGFPKIQSYTFLPWWWSSSCGCGGLSSSSSWPSHHIRHFSIAKEGTYRNKSDFFFFFFFWIVQKVCLYLTLWILTATPQVLAFPLWSY